MENKKKIIDEWTKITKSLNAQINLVKKLDAEREELSTLLHKLPDEEILKRMNENKEKYETILTEVKTLKKQSETLKKKLEKK